MKDSYFKNVISEINSLCSAIAQSEGVDPLKNTTIDVKDMDGLFAISKEKQALKNYLMELSDTTLNTICALMDFGRENQNKVLPINLTAVFNQNCLPYWFNKNKSQKKSWTVNYLADKWNRLPKYLKRAEELLFYSKEEEIKLIHDSCGGELIEKDGTRYVFGDWTEEDKYDEQDYELNLKCMKCGAHTTKVVNRAYFKKQI